MRQLVVLASRPGKSGWNPPSRIAVTLFGLGWHVSKDTMCHPSFCATLTAPYRQMGAPGNGSRSYCTTPPSEMFLGRPAAQLRYGYRLFGGRGQKGRSTRSTGSTRPAPFYPKTLPNHHGKGFHSAIHTASRTRVLYQYAL